MRRRPWSLILFDELEKAHEDVWALLLQLMEDGVLTDARGRRADFRNTVVVMTANVGAEQITREAGSLGFLPARSRERDPAELEARVLRELRQTFRPEFLNRVDETLVFRQLGLEDLERIAGRMTADFAARLREKGVALRVEDGAAAALAELGYDPAYGARPLRRALRRVLEDPAAQMLLEGKLRPGDTLRLSVREGRPALLPPGEE